MNKDTFIQLLNEIVSVVPEIQMKRDADKGRFSLSFIAPSINPKLITLIKKYDLHLKKQSGAFWEFEVAVVED